MMNMSLAHKFSVAATLMFAGWVVWILMLTTPQKKPEEKHIQENTKPKIQKITQLPKPQTTVALVLPAPPTPPEPVKEIAVVKAEVLKPVVKKNAPKPVPKSVKEVAPEPKKVATAKPTPKPNPQTVIKKRKITKPKPVEEKIQEVTKAQAVGGRALLRVLEHGKGPQIEIAWPQSSATRNRMFERLQACYGMENALMDAQGDLYRTDDPRGNRWEINMDRYSGFLRQAAGQLPSAEQRMEKAILRHHQYVKDPIVVRIFPRRVDASLLGGLKAVVGEGYMNASSIQARYEMKNGEIVVGDIRLNGRPINGLIALAPYKRCSRRA